MAKIYKFILISCLSILFFNLSTGLCQSNYIKKYRPLADSLSIEFKIPSNVILAIAIVESSSGQSRNCKLLNNHFGIVGKNNVLKTHGVKTRYKQYANDKASFIDFAKMISRKKYYQKFKGNTNSSDWIDVMSNHGYSEFPEIWRKKIKETIKKNKL